MKKFIVLSLAGILIFALGATVYAQAPKLEFRVSGFIDAQTFFQNNVPPYNTAAGLLKVTPGTSTFWAAPSGTIPAGYRTAGLNQTQAYWDSRASLKLDMVMGPNLSGTIMFEIDSAQWGSGPNGAGTSSGSYREANGYGYWSTLMESVTGPLTGPPSKSKTSTSISASPISESPYQLQ